MQLYFRKIGSGFPLVILHGLFGSSNNWNGLAKRLAERYTVYTPDLRNHGHSPHAPVHSYPTMAGDIAEFMRQMSIASTYLLGHSMGGKVAMELALSDPTLVQRLIVADIAPGKYPRQHDHIFDALLSLDVSQFHSRAEIDQALANQIPDDRLRGFLLTNLRRAEGGDFSWGMNLRVLDMSRDSIAEGLARGRRYEGPTLLMRGENSNYLSPHELDSVKELFPDVRIQTVRGAGHWIHADAPEEFIVLVNSFLNG